MEKQSLRYLLLEQTDKSKSSQFNTVVSEVIKTVKRDKTIKYRGDNLRKELNEILWDLIFERFITPGSADGHYEHRVPAISLTYRGEQVLKGDHTNLLVPDEYVTLLEKFAPKVDDVTKQYASEALRCYKYNLNFSAAVMIGAAAERCVLVLLETIADWEIDEKKKKNARNLLRRGRLPTIFNLISDTIKKAIDDKKMPYKIHEGALTHLFSFQEMIRVQRNEAVHPSAGKVSRDSAFLSLQTFPRAVSVIYRLAEWFSTEGKK